MASLGAFHHMHCLNVLRKYSYLDYYIVKEPDFFTAPTLRKHTGKLNTTSARRCGRLRS